VVVHIGLRTSRKPDFELNRLALGKVILKCTENLPTPSLVESTVHRAKRKPGRGADGSTTKHVRRPVGDPSQVFICAVPWRPEPRKGSCKALERAARLLDGEVVAQLYERCARHLVEYGPAVRVTDRQYSASKRWSLDLWNAPETTEARRIIDSRQSIPRLRCNGAGMQSVVPSDGLLL
jgi:hypothetical protein